MPKYHVDRAYNMPFRQHRERLRRPGKTCAFLSARVKRLPGTVTAVTGEGGICRGHSLSQKLSRTKTWKCICLIVPAEAATWAPNRSANTPAVNQ